MAEASGPERKRNAGGELERKRMGAKVRQRREALGLSQNDVAGAMRPAGFSWHQVTVYRVENGSRQLAVYEGLELCPVLEIDLETLADASDGHARAWALRSGARQVGQRFAAAQEQIDRLLDERAALQALLADDSAGSGGEDAADQALADSDPATLQTRAPDER